MAPTTSTKQKDLFDLAAEEEPPGHASTEVEEPPGLRLLKNRQRFFGSVSDVNWNDWKWQFRNRVTSVEDLSKLTPLSIRDQVTMMLVTSKYPISITPYYFCLIKQDDPCDPIRKQALPAYDEIALSGILSEDPLEEERDSVIPGLVHRYPDRILMVVTDICPMFCRHCTRKREWRRGRWVRTPQEIERMLSYIREHTGIRDVIISGGDPLTLSTRHLETIISKIRAIDHVEIIRIGSRVPVVLPQRIDNELCDMLAKYSPIWMNTHFNHVHELTDEAKAACDMILKHGIPVNNQSVLLAGINDSIEAQMKLCHGLLKAKVRPYYLFQADEVEGTEHLRTTREKGLRIIEGMRGHTSGLAIPTYVVDLPGGGGKVPLQASYLLSRSNGQITFRNYRGEIYRYHNPKMVNGDSGRNGRHTNSKLQMPLPDLVAV
ncbi:MAG: KamA family radical SAM protein [Dehalococcoidia bacterium]|nr:KamA family radical SAM protein [Dehalococcoidia bacterium]